jgi:hypothetical protein
MSQHHQFVEQRLSSARLEEALESYSVQELERWVLVRALMSVGSPKIQSSPCTIFASTVAKGHNPANYEEREMMAIDISSGRGRIT